VNLHAPDIVVPGDSASSGSQMGARRSANEINRATDVKNKNPLMTAMGKEWRTQRRRMKVSERHRRQQRNI
jgi:hypothetical protein